MGAPSDIETTPETPQVENGAQDHNEDAFVKHKGQTKSRGIVMADFTGDSQFLVPLRKIWGYN